MIEPSRRSSRLALAGGLGAALLCTGVGFTIGRSTAPPVAPPAPTTPISASPTPMPTPVAVPSVLTRAELLAAVRTAIEGMAGGTSAGPRMLAFEGRRFEVRLPFGCAGPTADGTERLRWRYDQDTGTLRIDVTPFEWPPVDWVAGGVEAGVERVEGFWISRPWTSSEACSPQAPATAPTASPSTSETLGLATFVRGDASRLGRRAGEAFSMVKKIAREEVDASRGFRLRLTGRLASAAGVGPITCRAIAGAYQRPTCLIVSALDELAVENGATGDVLATWSMTHQPGEVAAPMRRAVGDERQGPPSPFVGDVHSRRQAPLAGRELHC